MIESGSADRRRRTWPVFVFFACVYALSVGRGFYASDGEVMFLTTAALATRGTFQLAPDSDLPQIVPGDDGQFYSKYDPGLPLLALPLYAAGDWLGMVNHAHRYQLSALAVLMVPVLAAAGTVAALHALAGRLFGSRRGLWVALVAGLSTTLWPYARMLFAEAVLALALTGSAALLWGWPQARRAWRRALIAGVLFGLGVMTRAACAIYAAPLALLVLGQGGSGDRRRGLRYVVLFGVGMLPGAAAVLAHNALRFGDPLTFGYSGEGFTTPGWEGALGLLLSPGKGALLYAPPLALSALLWPRFRRRAPALAWFLLLAWGAALAFYGSWWAWDGGWSWGPRFVVPLLPLSCLPLGLLPDRRRWRGTLAALALAGIAIQGLAVLTDITPHYEAVAGDDPARTDAVNWSPADAPLAGAIDRALDGKTEPLAVFHLSGSGLPVTWVRGVPLLLVIGVVAAGWRVARRLRAL